LRVCIPEARLFSSRLFLVFPVVGSCVAYFL